MFGVCTYMTAYKAYHVNSEGLQPPGLLAVDMSTVHVRGRTQSVLIGQGQVHTQLW